MPIDQAPPAPTRDALRGRPGLRELQPAQRFGGFREAVEFALDIIAWRLPGSDPFVTRIDDDAVTLHRGPTSDNGAGPARLVAPGYAVMPLIGSGGRQLGSLSILDVEFPDASEQTVQRLLDAMGRLIISELEREERENDLRAMAETDQMTGLLNRGSFEIVLRREWQRARSGRADSRLVLTDVNGLKPVNDEFGHPTGDKLLWDVAEAISDAARESDTVARFGGDEFAVLLVDAGENGELRFRERLATELASRQSAGVTPSVAVGSVALAAAVSAEEAVARADRRMYRDKRRRFAPRDVRAA